MINKTILLVLLVLGIVAVAIVILNKDSKPKTSPGLPSPGLPPVTKPIPSPQSNVPSVTKPIPSPQSNVPPPQPIQNPNGPFYLQFLTGGSYLYLNTNSGAAAMVFTTSELSTASAFHLNSDGTLTLPYTNGSSQFMATGSGPRVYMAPPSLFTLTSTGANTTPTSLGQGPGTSVGQGPSTSLGQGPDYYGYLPNTISQLVRFYYLGSTTAYNGTYSTTNHTGYLAVDVPSGSSLSFPTPVSTDPPSELDFSYGNSPPTAAQVQLIPVNQ